MTLGSQKYFIVNDMPRNISVRNSVCAEASITAERTGVLLVGGGWGGSKKNLKMHAQTTATKKGTHFFVGGFVHLPPVRSVGAGVDDSVLTPWPTSVVPACRHRESRGLAADSVGRIILLPKKKKSFPPLPFCFFLLPIHLFFFVRLLPASANYGRGTVRFPRGGQ